MDIVKNDNFLTEKKDVIKTSDIIPSGREVNKKDIEKFVKNMKKEEKKPGRPKKEEQYAISK